MTIRDFSIAFGSKLSNKVEEQTYLYAFCFFIYILNTIIYFFFTSFFSVILKNFDIFQTPLSIANLISLTILSLSMPNWKYGAKIEKLSIKSNASKGRWFVFFTLPLALVFTTSSIIENNLFLQILLVFLNSFHLECMVIFRKTAANH